MKISSNYRKKYMLLLVLNASQGSVQTRLCC